MEGEKWILRLAAQLLREYSERLSNDGCNDFYIPEYTHPVDLLELIMANNPDKPSASDAEALTGYNWAVVDAVANYLDPMKADNPHQRAAE